MKFSPRLFCTAVVLLCFSSGIWAGSIESNTSSGEPLVKISSPSPAVEVDEKKRPRKTETRRSRELK